MLMITRVYKIQTELHGIIIKRLVAIIGLYNKKKTNSDETCSLD